MLGICIVLIGSSIVAALGLSAGAGSSYPERLTLDRDSRGRFTGRRTWREVKP